MTDIDYSPNAAVTPTAAPRRGRRIRPIRPVGYRQTRQEPAGEYVPVLGLDLWSTTRDAAADWLIDRARRRHKTRVAFMNAHCFNVARRDESYRAELGGMTRLFPDGSGVAAAARMKGRRFEANLNGTDLYPELCRRAAEAGLKVFLLGARPGVADRMAEAAEAQWPGLIAGTHHGYLRYTAVGDIAAEINESGADIVLVAMGVPMQEHWIARYAKLLRAPVVLGVGGLFDFMAGEIPRAPMALRTGGLEWTWRLAQEPRRMWRRYILGNPAFLAAAAWDAAAPLRRRIDAAARRVMDIAAAACGLALLSPLLAGTALAIRLESRGPALFRQTRVGKDGRKFTLWKFRSMYQDAEARRAALGAANQHGSAGVTFKMRDDPRITRIGRIIRKLSIDELPQLWNVLKGDMALVGPRPPLPSEVARYDEFALRRLSVRPGLTCTWQISGRADLPFDKQVELDLTYIQRCSLLTDIVILLKTPAAVLSGRGAY